MLTLAARQHEGVTLEEIDRRDKSFAQANDLTPGHTELIARAKEFLARLDLANQTHAAALMSQVVDALEAGRR